MLAAVFHVFLIAGLGDKLQLPDLGRGTKIGALYDVLEGNFLDVPLWPYDVIADPEIFRTTPAQFSSLLFSHSEELQDRARLQNVNAEVTAGIAGGFLSLSGSVEILKHSRHTRYTAEVVANYRVETRRTSINIHDPRLCASELRVQDYPGLSRATHVVTAILYGGDCGAIFSAESQDMYDKSVEIKKIRAKLDVGFLSTSKTLVDEEESSESSMSSDKIRVQIYGDLLPDNNMPTNVSAAITYMSALPSKISGEGDVPKQLHLTPLAELPPCRDGATAKGRRLRDLNPQPPKHEVPAGFVTATLALLSDMDTSLQCLNELLLEPHHGFLSLTRAANCQIAKLRAYRTHFGGQLKAAMQAYRSAGDLQELDRFIRQHQDSGYSLQDLDRACSELRTQFSTADFLASSMMVANLTLSSHLSGLLGPSLDPTVEMSYMLIFVGAPDAAQNRESLQVLADFVNFAERTSQAATCGDDKLCHESTSFTAIQFDSFCLSFCRPELCRRWLGDCAQEEAASRNPLKKHSAFGPLLASWCEAPQTSVVVSVRNLEPELVPFARIRVPMTRQLADLSVRGDRIELHFREEPDEPWVLHRVLRISWEEAKHTEKGLQRSTHQQDYEMHGLEPTVRVTLRVGRSYSFQVAAVNSVGTGGFSNRMSDRAASAERRLQGTNGFRMPVPVVGPHSAGDALSLPSRQQNRAPNWRCFPVAIALSADAVEEIAEVRFYDPEGLRENFSCFSSAASLDLIHCHIPQRAASQDVTWHFDVFGVVKQIAEPGVLLHEAPSIESCRRWDEALYCDSIPPACVPDCYVCATRTHATAAPNCSQTVLNSSWSSAPPSPSAGLNSSGSSAEGNNVQTLGPRLFIYSAVPVSSPSLLYLGSMRS